MTLTTAQSSSGLRDIKNSLAVSLGVDASLIVSVDVTAAASLLRDGRLDHGRARGRALAAGDVQVTAVLGLPTAADATRVAASVQTVSTSFAAAYQTTTNTQVLVSGVTSVDITPTAQPAAIPTLQLPTLQPSILPIAQTALKGAAPEDTIIAAVAAVVAFVVMGALCYCGRHHIAAMYSGLRERSKKVYMIDINPNPNPNPAGAAGDRQQQGEAAHLEFGDTQSWRALPRSTMGSNAGGEGFESSPKKISLTSRPAPMSAPPSAYKSAMGESTTPLTPGSPSSPSSRNANAWGGEEGGPSTGPSSPFLNDSELEATFSRLQAQTTMKKAGFEPSDHGPAGGRG